MTTPRIADKTADSDDRGAEIDLEDETDDATDGDADEENEDEIEEIDPTDEELGGNGGLFSGVEDAGGESSETGGDAEQEDQTTSEGEAGIGSTPPQLEQTINEGAARLAVVGLDDDDEADDLEEEFQEVFQTFRLGHFGARTIDEYILIDDEDVSPAWGLAATIAACTAFTLWMRPDGEDQLKRAKEAIDSIANGKQVGS
jgi:hypothetical protein